VIVDDKTDRSVHTPPYELQIQLYALALERALNRTPTRGVLCFLRSNQCVEVDLSPLALNAAREAAREFTRAQESLNFPLNTGAQCERCDYYGNLCPALLHAAVECVQ
jgi:CRISPR/Cas system-associated exonuclease Cas4 (RecB family)